ncbi:hypothetical protein Hypma_009936 [Hypsizygus marmoreus]|uniref:factor independent urate hydroxylase n=1 Tax=Hypsizygus marmoreus TaxID=39966 RepID=A0A369JLL9_HYPMA|nr:hypothetical protein Hypma_009936 [Hypsizygus marmoreus]
MSGLFDLLVLKTIGSAFTDFVRDTYTALAEVSDRIFSTTVELSFSNWGGWKGGSVPGVHYRALPGWLGGVLRVWQSRNDLRLAR